MKFKVLLYSRIPAPRWGALEVTRTEESEDMKYLMIGELRKPYEENRKKMYEIEEKRTEKGEVLGDAIIFPQHLLLSKENASFRGVDCEEEKLAKWIAAYQDVADFKIHPIMARSEFEKFTS